MTFDDNKFSVVLDKGTIDALMSNKSEQVTLSKTDNFAGRYVFVRIQVLADIDAILQQVERVLRITGRFICITLAQKHILDHVSQYFFNQK